MFSRFLSKCKTKDVNIVQQFLYFLIILFLPTQLGKHFWPNFSLVLGQRIDYLSPTLFVTDVLIVLLFVIWLTSLRGRMTKQSRQSNIQSHEIASLYADWFAMTFKKYIFFILLITFLVINISQSPFESVYGLLKLFEMAFLTYYTGNILRRDLKILIFPLMFGIISESILAIAQFFTQSSIGGILYYFGERTFTSVTPGIANASINGQLLLRPYATFSHPNVLAGYLVIGMTILLRAKLKIENVKLYNVLLALAVLIGTIGLAATLSRAAILVWLFVGVFLFIHYFQKKLFTRKILLFANAVLGTIFITLFVFSPLLPRFSELTLQDESIVIREQLVYDAFQMMFAHPVFGVGIHNFLPALPSYDFNRGSVFSIQPVHNIFLLAGAETGFIGLWLSVSFVIWLYLRLFILSRHCEESHIFGTTRQSYERFLRFARNDILFSPLLLTEVVILGSFDHYFLTIQQGQMLLGLVLGICLFATHKSTLPK